MKMFVSHLENDSPNLNFTPLKDWGLLWIAVKQVSYLALTWWCLTCILGCKNCNTVLKTKTLSRRIELTFSRETS